MFSRGVLGVGCFRAVEVPPHYMYVKLRGPIVISLHFFPFCGLSGIVARN